MRNSRLPLIALLVLGTLLLSCKKRKTNSVLYEEAKASGLTFYKNKDTTWPAKGGSPHGPFKLKFNSTAVAAFDSTGKLPAGVSFPTGSLIVKEIYENGSLTLYAVMKKEPGNKWAGEGWLWGEYDKDGDTKFSVAEEGSGCTGCHSTSPHRDYARSFDLH